jgi:hypothetical protein
MAIDVRGSGCLIQMLVCSALKENILNVIFLGYLQIYHFVKNGNYNKILLSFAGSLT